MSEIGHEVLYAAQEELKVSSGHDSTGRMVREAHEWSLVVIPPTGTPVSAPAPPPGPMPGPLPAPLPAALPARPLASLPTDEHRPLPRPVGKMYVVGASDHVADGGFINSSDLQSASSISSSAHWRSVSTASSSIRAYDACPQPPSPQPPIWPQPPRLASPQPPPPKPPHMRSFVSASTRRWSIVRVTYGERAPL